MVRNVRIRSYIARAGLWALIAALMAYFAYHGLHGERGLRANRSYEAEIASLKEELARLESDRKALEHRVARFEPKAVDRDLLDEKARENLGWMHPDDRILILPE